MASVKYIYNTAAAAENCVKIRTGGSSSSLLRMEGIANCKTDRKIVKMITTKNV